MRQGAPRSLWDVGKVGVVLFVLGRGGIQAQSPSALATDYSHAVKPFPWVYKPYHARAVPRARLSNASKIPLEVRDGKFRLSMAQLVAAVVQNNLTVASARYYPAEAQTDLLRARSGASPRG